MASASSTWGPSHVTVEWWQRTRNHGFANQSGVGTAYDDSSTGGWHCATEDSSGTTHLYSSMRYATSGAGTTVNTAISDSDWHHYACTYDGAYLKLWVDGALAETLSYGGGIQYTGQPLTVLNRNMWWTGGTKDYDIRELKVSNTALYSSTFTPSWTLSASSSTIAYWKFNEGAGTTFGDSARSTSTTAHGSLSWTTTGAYCP